MNRRNFVKSVGLSGLATSFSLQPENVFGFQPANASVHTTANTDQVIRIDPKPLFELSPWLYMQFMEPLGVTDSSVEAAWDHQRDSWKTGVIEVTRDLAPGMVRWGGLLSAYYRWKEAVGPREKRVPLYNISWGGYETNQVGTAEFVEFCRLVNAEPLLTVNFEAEGDPGFIQTRKGDIRSGDATEAAEWVDYCNNPKNALRLEHGITDPLRVNIWQIGNETSYSNRRFDRDTAVRKTVEFANAMRKSDPTIKLIAWGEGGFAEKMINDAGDKIDYIAFHHMFDPGRPARDNEYRDDPAATWEVLMNACKMHERKINMMREQVVPYNFPLAMTECHFAVPGRNRCEFLSSWAAGISYARMANVHERHGDLLKIATLADFCGTRWQVNALMIPVPSGRPYLMPVAKVMSLYRKFSGTNFVKTETTGGLLDVTASRTGDTVYLHIVNTSRTLPTTVQFLLEGMTIQSGMAHEIAGPPEFEIIRAENDPLTVKTKEIDILSPYVVPPASVTAISLNCQI